MPNTSKLEESEEEKLKSMPLSELIRHYMYGFLDRSLRIGDDNYRSQIAEEIDRREKLYLMFYQNK